MYLKTKVDGRYCAAGRDAIPALILLMAAQLSCWPNSKCSAQSLEEVIADVAAHEALYASIEVDVHIAYQHLGPLPKVPKSAFTFTTDDQKDIKYVSQGRMFRFDVVGSFQSEGSEQRKNGDETRMFDGSKTRVLTNGVANIIDGVAMDKLNLRPHMLLLSIARHPVPLSTYLRGDAAMKACPDVRIHEGIGIAAEALGRATLDGLECVKVRVTHSKGDTAICGGTLWLAIDRNYIPVRLEVVTYQWSKEIPDAVGTVGSLSEIEPGVWFPQEARITSFEPFALQARNEQRPNWQRTFTIENVSLRPAHAERFFTDLVIPDGTAVYEVGADRKIRRSYVQGAPEAGSTRLEAQNRWVLWANIAVVAVTMVTLAWRSSRKRRHAQLICTNSGERQQQ